MSKKTAGAPYAFVTTCAGQTAVVITCPDPDDTSDSDHFLVKEVIITAWAIAPSAGTGRLVSIPVMLCAPRECDHVFIRLGNNTLQHTDGEVFATLEDAKSFCLTL